MQWCSDGKAEGYVAFHSISNLWYLLKDREDSLRRESLKRVCRILTVCGTSHEAVERAIDRADFRDFEDCLQDQCALSVGADYIVTRNVRDFANAGTEAITPSDFIRYNEEGSGGFPPELQSE